MPKRVTDQGVIGKMLSTGLDLLAVAEEGARKPGKLPRDVAAHLAKFLDRQKDEIMLIVREEIRYALNTLPFEDIVRDVLTGHDVHLTLHMSKRKPKKRASAARKKRS